jgi:hypothetical protein
MDRPHSLSQARKGHLRDHNIDPDQLTRVAFLFVFQVGEEIVFFVEGKQLQSDPVVRVKGITSMPQVRTQPWLRPSRNPCFDFENISAFKIVLKIVEKNGDLDSSSSAIYA